MIREEERVFRVWIVSLVATVAFALPFQHSGQSAISRGLGGLFGPSVAHAQEPCITHVYDVHVSETACNLGDCHGDIWVHDFEDGVETGFHDASIPFEPPQLKNCYSTLECDPGDSPQCDFDSGNKPCYDVPCRDYMMECGEIRTIQWWNDIYAPAHGLPPIGQETVECDEEPDEDDDDCTAETGAPVNVTNGNMYHEERDIELKIPGMGLNFSRFYNSRSARPGPVGYGWTHNYEIVMEAAGASKVRVNGPRGKGVTFRQQIISYPEHGYDERYSFAKFGRKKTRMTWDGDAEIYAWEAKDKKTYLLDAEGKTFQMEDGKGNSLTFSYNAGTGLLATVTDDFGRSLIFTYYPDGKLETVTDPAGHTVTYHYTGENLTQVDYPDGRYKSYRYEDPYDSHNLTSILFGRAGATEPEYEWTYDDQDRAETSSRAGGNELVTLDYISETQTEMTNSRSELTTFTFERIQGRLKVTDIFGPGCPSCGASSDTTYGYDDDQRLVSMTDGEGNLTEYLDHDTRGQPWTVVEASGSPEQRTVNYKYHPDLPGVMLSRETQSVLNPSSLVEAVTVYDYDDPDAPGDDPDLTNEQPTKLLYKYIRAGWLRQYTDDQLVPTKYITSYQYNGYGQVTQIDGPRGDVADVTGFAYDPVTGDLLTKTEPLAGPTTYGDYDDNGNVGAVTDVNGNATTYAYDERNRVETVTQVGAGPSGEDLVTAYVYEGITGRLDYIRLPEGNYVDYSYDVAGRLERIVKTASAPAPGVPSQGETIRYEYDTEGNRLREEYIDPQGAVVKFTDFRYDAYNRLEKEFNPEYGDPAGNPYYKLYGYDGTGFRTSLTDERGYQTEYAPDSLRRLRQVTHHFENAGGTDSDTYVTEYGYDLQDNLTSIEDANGNLTTCQFDDFGNLLDATSPDTGLTQYRYSGVDLLRKKTLADATVIDYFYDALNRLILVDFPDDSQNIIYNYDEPGSANGMGRLTSMEDPSGTTVFHYNALGKVTREVKTIDAENYEVAYGYDANGNPASVTYPDGRVVAYTTDSYDRVRAISQDLNGYVSNVVTQATHLPNGPVETLDFPGAVATWSAGYGARYRMETLSAGGILDRTYGFDFSGNIDAITDNLTPSKSMSFGYDSLNRLEEADGPWGTGGGYTYDPVGNRLTKDIGASTTYTYAPGTNKPATAVGAEPAVFSHDANGNMTGDGTRTYVYSENQRLIQVLDGATPVGDYVYDGQGKRVKKTAGGVTTVFLYDRAGNTLAEIAKGQGAGGSDVHQDYIWLDNLRVAMVVGEVGVPCIDTDGDGFGDPASPACTYPYWDCDDDTSADPPACSSCTCGSADCAPCARCKNPHPYTTEFSGDGIDSNCDGQDDPPGCFIATVAFGSPLAGEVATFRAFRDRYLRTNRLGSLLVELYYKHGPKAAGFIEGRKRLKGLVRGALYPMAALCAFALEATARQKALVTVVTLLVPFGIVLLVSRSRGRGMLEYKKALCVLLAVVFTFDTVMLGYFGVGGGVKEVQAAVPDGIYFYLNDHLGTPLKMVDEGGAVVWSADYLPFGLATVDPASTVESNWRFPGQYEDQESGLFYNLMRSYSPGLGRYTRPDPSLSLGTYTVDYRLPYLRGFPQELNEYSYCQNSPANTVDPLGLEPCPPRQKCINDAVTARKWCTRVAWVSQGLCTASCALICTGAAVGYLACLIPCTAACHAAFSSTRKICWATFFVQLHVCYSIKCDPCEQG